jgi:hemoglobin-like flavoprotein
MDLDADLLRESFALVAHRSPDLTRRFYEILFARYPVVRPMFSANTAQQERMLRDTLAAVIDHLDDAPWLDRTLQALGAKHIGYGVRDEMYAWVVECLLAALEEASGEAWNDEVQAAWAAALGAVVSMMLAGAEAVRPQRPRGDAAISSARPSR